jgi:hypothetical protein
MLLLIFPTSDRPFYNAKGRHENMAWDNGLQIDQCKGQLTPVEYLDWMINSKQVMVHAACIIMMMNTL